MHDAIRQAITELSALLKGTDSEDAERIREMIERLRNFDADTQYTLECIARLHKKLYRWQLCERLLTFPSKHPNEVWR